jgi:Na+/melibiose symporter-like transporter
MPFFQANGGQLVPLREPARRFGVGNRRSDDFSFRVSQGDFRMLVGALVTFLVVILILYLVNLLPLDGRAKQIVRVVVIILGVISLLKYIAVF